METIKDITAEMRNRSVTVIGGRTITMRNFVSQEQCEEWADRIEKATAQCNQLKMREALLIVKLLFDDRIMFQPAIRAAHQAVNDALSEPPRNCDKFAKAEVLEMLDDCSFSKEDTIEWLYATEGENDEQK